MSGAIKQARANFQGDTGYARAMPGTGYAGDPGLFGSIFGGIKKGLGLASSVVPFGGIAGRVIGGVSSYISRRRNPRQIGTRRGRVALAPPPGQQFQILPGSRGPMAVEPVPGIRGIMQRAIPGGATGLQVPGTAIGARVPQGYHLNKSGYWRGAGGMNPEWIPKESIFVKNRKRNPLNPRAFDRAFGRIKSAKNFGKKLSRVTIREAC